MQKIINKLIKDNPDIAFEADDHFVWSPEHTTIRYDQEAMDSARGVWSLLHEIGHAKLDHSQYRDDFHLLIMEVNAWEKACEVAKHYEVTINDKHIESCVDSYRDWLYSRSKCIDCGANSMQKDRQTYHCHNCNTKWRVPESKLCRVRKQRI